MEKQPNVFSFYLDEALWFKEGQGVRELVGISLEPEITIEPLGDDVCLSGMVVLTGEYRVAAGSEMESTSQASRFMDEVIAGEEGITHFSHMFPIEITVPLNRVARLDEVYVDIENFDYEIPASHQLRLQAEVTIHGIEQQIKADSDQSAVHDGTTIGPVDFQEYQKEERPVLPEREAPIIQVNNDDYNEEGRWPKKKTQSFSEFFHHEIKEESYDVSSESTSIWEEQETETQEEVEYEADQESSSSDKQKDAPSGMDGIKQIFKHLFPNRDETYTQMKMYIVQEDETLQSIAEKYDVSIKQLERLNDYREEVSQGEIVYIPR